MAVTETGHLASREIDELYRRHGGEVYRYAYAVLGNHADAEDLTQTTFLNAYRSLEQGVRPRKPSNWLLTIASNAIKQRFRQEHARPRHVELDEQMAKTSVEEDDGPSVGELLAALAKIPPQQRQAIVLREFEGRSYAEIAEILGVTTSALETLLFRARRSLAEELEHQLTCTEAQLAFSRAADGRLGRKERRRLRDHLGECPDCARFARVQQRHRRALKGLVLVPIPLSLSFFKGLEGTASAATVPASASVAAVGASTAAVGASAGAAGATGGGVLAGGVALKAAAVVTAATMAGGIAVAGSSEVDSPPAARPPALSGKPGERVGQIAPRGVLVPGQGVALGKADAPGQAQRVEAKAGASAATSTSRPAPGRRESTEGTAPGQQVSGEKRADNPSSTRSPDSPSSTKYQKDTAAAKGDTRRSTHAQDEAQTAKREAHASASTPARPAQATERAGAPKAP